MSTVSIIRFGKLICLKKQKSGRKKESEKMLWKEKQSEVERTEWTNLSNFKN